MRRTLKGIAAAALALAQPPAAQAQSAPGPIDSFAHHYAPSPLPGMVYLTDGPGKGGALTFLPPG